MQNNMTPENNCKNEYKVKLMILLKNKYIPTSSI